jgi:hypothetical protein
MWSRASNHLHPVSLKQHLQELRIGIGGLSDNPQFRDDLDCLEATVVAATAVRNDIAHGAFGLSNPDGTLEKLRIICVPYRRPKGKPAPKPQMVFHMVSELFRISDQIWDDRNKLESLVREACAKKGSRSTESDGGNETA